MNLRFYVLLVSCIFLTLSLAVNSHAGDGKYPKSGSEKKSSFRANRQWEQRITDLQRSGDEVKIISPKPGANFQSEEIVFEWNHGLEKNMFLGLLTNENKEVYYKEVSGNRTIVEARSLGLKPGLYYWVLESEEDIQALGKFFYKKK